MHHRKRSRLQHKVELSTLLRIVMAKKRNKRAATPANDEQNLIGRLAAEAIRSAKKCDAPDVRNVGKRKSVPAVSAEVL